MSTAPPLVNKTEQQAYRLIISGQVQGVGFRPFVYRNAQDCGIKGWVQNKKGDVHIHAQGSKDKLDIFIQHLVSQAPAVAQVKIKEKTAVAIKQLSEFKILASNHQGEKNIHIPIDYPICHDCLVELNDPHNRRYQYPFINCTQCGPRYTIIQQLPYDRKHTTMAGFALCSECRKEYHDPGNRRFHAEPIACPQCGPQLSFEDHSQRITDSQTAIKKTINGLQQGKIIAIKGVGGYHLLCDAGNDQALTTLRQRKQRPDKPFAVMFPLQGEDGLALVRQYVETDAASADLLNGPIHPLVLLPFINNRKKLSAYIAPKLKHLGVLLPYSPLHQLIVNGFNAPMVVTSANISGEPVITDNREAEQRLATLADAFLHHDRPIARPADDSVYQMVKQQTQALRLGRGTAPLELTLPFPLNSPLLAVGGHLKNTVALAWENRVLISAHIGELDSPKSLATFEQTIRDLQQLYEVEAETVICDAHPAYRSHRWAKHCAKAVYEVYHHYAHASALVLEHVNKVDASLPWLVFTWDGVGYGEDKTLWGGEALFGRPGHWQRVASFKPFTLAGGDKASRQPWRSAASLCWHTGHTYDPSPLITTEEYLLVKKAWQQNINCASTTAVGRLFDAALDHCSCSD